MFFKIVPGGFSDLKNQNSYNSNRKKIFGFRNLQEKLEKKTISLFSSTQIKEESVVRLYDVGRLKADEEDFEDMDDDDDNPDGDDDGKILTCSNLFKLVQTCQNLSKLV